MEYSRSAIRELVTKALTLDELNDLVFDYFPDVDEEFAEGQTKSQRIKILLRYAEKHRKKNYLLDKIKKINPPVFQEFKSSVWETANLSDLARSQEEQAINKLIEDLQNKSFDKLKSIYLSCCPKNAIKIVNDIDNILIQLNRNILPQGYRPVIPFVVRVKQQFPDSNLQNWLELYGNLFGYDKFQRTPQQIAPSYNSQNANQPESYLLIELNKVNPSYLQIQGWFWSDNLRCNIQEKDMIELGYTALDFNERYHQLSEKITKLIQESNTIMGEIGSEDLRIELFIETNLLTENDFYVDWLKVKKGNYYIEMCQQYIVTFRLAERLKDNYQDSRGKWKRKWEKLNSNNYTVLDYCQNVGYKLWLDEIVGMKLNNISDQDNFFELIYLKSIPIALWSRRDLQTISCQNEINRILKNVQNNFYQLPQEVKNERNKAVGAEHIGHHICLLWDNPYRIPPDPRESQYRLNQM